MKDRNPTHRSRKSMRHCVASWALSMEHKDHRLSFYTSTIQQCARALYIKIEFNLSHALLCSYRIMQSSRDGTTISPDMHDETSALLSSHHTQDYVTLGSFYEFYSKILKQTGGLPFIVHNEPWGRIEMSRRTANHYLDEYLYFQQIRSTAQTLDRSNQEEGERGKCNIRKRCRPSGSALLF